MTCQIKQIGHLRLKISMMEGKLELNAPVRQVANRMVLDPKHLEQSLCRFVVIPTIAIGPSSSAVLQLSVAAIDFVRPLEEDERIAEAADPNATVKVYGAVPFSFLPDKSDEASAPAPAATDAHEPAMKKRKKDKKNKKNKAKKGSKK
jgi:hypothetical protein